MSEVNPELRQIEEHKARTTKHSFFLDFGSPISAIEGHDHPFSFLVSQLICSPNDRDSYRGTKCGLTISDIIKFLLKQSKMA